MVSKFILTSKSTYKVHELLGKVSFSSANSKGFHAALGWWMARGICFRKLAVQ